jgi:hypothetical protein
MSAASLELKTLLLVAQRSITKANQDVAKVVSAYQKTGSYNVEGFGLTRGDVVHLEEEMQEVTALAARLVKLIK